MPVPAQQKYISIAMKNPSSPSPTPRQGRGRPRSFDRDAALAKAIRDGDDDVRFAAWACCTAAIRASPDALVRLLAHAGVYEFLVSGPPPDDAIEAKRIKHAFVCAVSERSGGMDDDARRAIDAAAQAGPFRRAPGTASPEVALASR